MLKYDQCYKEKENSEGHDGLLYGIDDEDVFITEGDKARYREICGDSA